MDSPDMFMDPAHTRSSHMRISTSQVNQVSRSPDQVSRGLPHSYLRQPGKPGVPVLGPGVPRPPSEVCVPANTNKPVLCILGTKNKHMLKCKSCVYI